MPKYEMMYIVASSVSDDQIPAVTDGVLKYITELGGTVVKEEKLGKKKLAYPIKKTRNGFYDAVVFEMDGKQVNELDLKLRSSADIIRHIVVNIEEALVRIQKDAEAQEKMNRSRSERAKASGFKGEKTEQTSEGKAEISDEKLNQKIEEALSEDLTNI